MDKIIIKRYSPYTPRVTAFLFLANLKMITVLITVSLKISEFGQFFDRFRLCFIRHMSINVHGHFYV